MRPGATLEDLHLDYNEYAFNPIMDSVQQVSKYVDEDGLVEVAEAPTGFMCIKRTRPTVRRDTRWRICTGAFSIA